MNKVTAVLRQVYFLCKFLTRPFLPTFALLTEITVNHALQSVI